MPIRFPFCRQFDAMDCGPTCLMMVAAAHGRLVSLDFLREKSHFTREGVSALGIMQAAEAIGLRLMTVKVPFDAPEKATSLMSAPLPCVAHWNQSHFVVIYRADRKTIWIADPGEGKIKIPRADFEKSWASDGQDGILILLEPTPDFYRNENAPPRNEASFSLIFEYLRPHRRLLFQLIVGMAVASGLGLILPFLTQSVVDKGIAGRSIGFIYLVLAAQLMLFLGQMTVQFIQNRILLFVGARMNVSMVHDFLAKLMRLPLGFFDVKMTGDLIQRIGDQQRIEAFFDAVGLDRAFFFDQFWAF